MSTAALKRLSWEQYVEQERHSEIKHEFFDGEVFAMSGGTANHSLVGTNISGEARDALKSRPCVVLGPDMRVLCPTGLGTYPDVSIYCGEPEYQGDKKETLLNPLVIFEVLSPSTEAYDRGKKFMNYQSIASLKEYVLVAQDEPRIEHYARQADTSQWLLTTFAGLDATLQLPTVEIELPLRDVYAKVTFEEETLHDGVEKSAPDGRG